MNQPNQRQPIRRAVPPPASTSGARLLYALLAVLTVAGLFGCVAGCLATG